MSAKLTLEIEITVAGTLHDDNAVSIDYIDNLTILEPTREGDYLIFTAHPVWRFLSNASRAELETLLLNLPHLRERAEDAILEDASIGRMNSL